MQVHVKTPHTRINVEGQISKRLLNLLKEDYGDSVIIEDDEWVVATETEWYKKAASNMTPGDYMRAYRISRGMTQAELGKLIGGLSRQWISDIERGRRPVSKEIAKKLAEIFKTAVDKFL